MQFAHITEDVPGKFSAFASDLELGPGVWPERLDIPELKGNGMPFMRGTKKIDADGDLEYVRYNQANGSFTLIIYND